MIPRALVRAPWPAWRHGLIAGAAIALLGVSVTAVPWFWPLQESFDLWALFKLRGPQSPPDDIVLVTIDQQSSERIALPTDPEARDRCLDLRIGEAPRTHERVPPPHLVLRWPRCLHALAIRTLAKAGARVIALDVSFRPLSVSGSANALRLAEQEDRAVADAMESAGNVVLAQWLDPVDAKELHAILDPRASWLQRPARMSPLIESSALGAAPLRLAWGQSGRVNAFAVFSEEEAPISSMPALIVHFSVAEVQAEFVRLIAKASPDNAELLPRNADELAERRPLQASSLAIRNLVRSEPGVASALHESLQRRDGANASPHRRAALRALVDLYSGDSIRYLNFYGYPGTFRSVSYADVLKGATGGQLMQDLRGKTVIVGYVDFAPTQRDDHYPTVFTTDDGVKLSGSEILATAVANLATNSTLTAPSPALRMLITACFGLALGLVLLVPPPLPGFAGAAALCAAYLGVALLAFRFEAVWLPVLVPLMVQAPAGLLYAVTHHYRDLRSKRDELRHLFGKFLPDAVIESLLQHKARLETVNEAVYGVCLATDAERFSTLAESMHPAQLARYLNQYFEVLFPRITAKDGWISDLIGDAVLAFWTGEDGDRGLHTKAAGAALELMSGVEQFNAASPAARLPTRIGISSGPVTTSAMGAANRYEFRPVGDTVVISFRLQELNKLLGTRILVSESVIRGTDAFLVRDVGVFQLRGRTAPTHVFELLEERETASGDVLQLCLEFALALDALRGGRREDALRRFRAIRDRYPQDGPTAFYVRWLSSNPLWGSGPIPQ